MVIFLISEPISRLDERRKHQGGSNKSDTVVVGCKRGFSENWSRGYGGGEMNRGIANGNACKRSKQTSSARSQPKINDSGGGCSGGGGSDGGGDGRRIRGLDSGPSKSATIADEVAGRTVTNSVLMNLLVSGCDMSAGYVCMTSSVRKRLNCVSGNGVVAGKRSLLKRFSSSSGSSSFATFSNSRTTNPFLTSSSSSSSSSS